MSRSLKSRSLVVMFALVASFATSAFFPSETSARVPAGPRLDSLSDGCGRLQDEYDQAVRELGAAQKGTQAQYDAAFRRVQSLQAQWAGSPCAKAFGSLIFRGAPISTGKPGIPTLARGENVKVSSSQESSTRGVSIGNLRSVLKKK